MNLNGKRIILASQSPRRKELMQGLDLDFTIALRSVDEKYPLDLDPLKVPEFLSNLKADSFILELEVNDILITADTIVIHQGKILEKPADVEDAVRMLRLLSGSVHTVVTGVCILHNSTKTLFSDQSEVTFENLTDEEISYYVQRYKPFDKAGSYGVQDWIGYIGISKIVGSFYTVMGFPVHLVYQELKRILI